MRVDLTFPPLWSYMGRQPAHEDRFLAVGNTDMSPPISDRTAIAVSWGVAEIGNGAQKPEARD